jgi:hypothetical protein
LTNAHLSAIILIERRKELITMARNIRINFDLDGTIADLYGVENWLGYILAEDTTPYEMARPLVRFATLARRLNTLQRNGYEIAVITWLARGATEEYDRAVANAKVEWLNRHLPTVNWNEIHILPYGTPKENYCNNPLDILFDDEEHNRENWTGRAYDVQNILEILANL